MTGSATPRLAAIFVCARAGEAMQAIDTIEVLAGFGLAGDRYATGIGVYSKIEPIKVRHVTLIAQAAIDAAAPWFAEQGQPAITAAQTRRNLLIEGIAVEDLNALVGRTFSVGGILMHGLEPADPCPRPTRLLKRTGFDVAFRGMGGVRAEALGSGVLKVGDALV